MEARGRSGGHHTGGGCVNTPESVTEARSERDHPVIPGWSRSAVRRDITLRVSNNHDFYTDSKEEDMQTQPLPWHDMRTPEEADRDNFIRAWEAMQGLTPVEADLLNADDYKALGEGWHADRRH